MGIRCWGSVVGQPLKRLNRLTVHGLETLITSVFIIQRFASTDNSKKGARKKASIKMAHMQEPHMLEGHLIYDDPNVVPFFAAFSTQRALLNFSRI